MNKKELKEQTYKKANLIFHPDINDYEQEFIELGVLHSLIDQLDETKPQLTNEWINSHLTDGHNVSMGEKVIYVEDLEDFLKGRDGRE